MTDTTNEVAKMAPPISIGGLSLLSIPLNDWVLILTIVYTGILIVDKLFPRFIQRTANWVLNKLRGL